MRCIECRESAKAESAVTCPWCNAGVCSTHLESAARRRGPGGTSIGCDHEAFPRVLRGPIGAAIMAGAARLTHPA
jgi:hypothetical protein